MKPELEILEKLASENGFVFEFVCMREIYLYTRSSWDRRGRFSFRGTAEQCIAYLEKRNAVNDKAHKKVLARRARAVAREYKARHSHSRLNVGQDLTWRDFMVLSVND